MIESFLTMSSDSLDEKENAYIQAFLDIALKYSVDSSADFNTFLDWWDEKGSKKALFSPDNQDAIRLITIHKSKGLGFGVVIMPFVNWRFENNSSNNILWCKPSVAPFAELGVAPLRYGKYLTDTIFRNDYLNEKRLTLIDNLNLLYVAFTRAKHRLIIYSPSSGKSEVISNAAVLMQKSIGDNITLSGDCCKELEDESVLELGEPSKRDMYTDKRESNTYKSSKWHSQPFDNRLKLRLNSIGFFSDDGSRDYGKLMHDIVSNIKIFDDIPEAVNKKISEGELYEHERDRIVNELYDYLNIPAVKNWYSGNYKVLNEAVVLQPGSRFSRPDRVMIGNNEVIVVDYKFGDVEESKYKHQVRRYMKTISEMGYPNVKGFVFYVRSGRIESL